MQKTTTDPSQWFADLPDDIRADMQQLDTFISTHLATASRTLWEGTFWGGTEQTIIGYGDLRLTQSRGRVVDWFMVGLARQKAHISLYVNAVVNGKYATQVLGPRLGKVKVGASSIAIRNLTDVDLDVLAELLSLANAHLTNDRNA
jgi:hypothetical protein